MSVVLAAEHLTKTFVSLGPVRSLELSEKAEAGRLRLSI